ncbi:MAG: cation transporter, partial [Chitinophagales bacterium]
MQKAYEKIQLQVEGMTCANCALGITRLLEQKGMDDVYVNFATGEVHFANAGDKQLPELVNGIESLGYKVVDEQQSATQKKSALTSTEKKLIATLPFTLLLLLAMVPGLSFLHQPLIQLLLCLPVYLIGFFHFGKSALGSIKSGIMNMDVLIFTGSTAAFGYSVFGFVNQLGMDYQFFETAATIITLVLLGNVIEHRSVKQT